MPSLSGNWRDMLELQYLGFSADAAPLVWPVREAKCSDILIIMTFKAESANNGITEISVGDLADGSDGTPIDLTDIDGLDGGAAGKQVFMILLKDMCHKYFKVTTTGTGGSDVSMHVLHSNCRQYPRENNTTLQSAVTISCTCPE